MTLVKWNPNRYPTHRFNAWDRLFSNFLTDGWDGASLPGWVPSMDVQETGSAYVLTADLPGLTRQDIKVNFKDNVLEVSGERKSENKVERGDYFQMERGYGEFCRSFRLPENVQEDKIAATFKDGVLTIEIPKAEEIQPKAIEIKVN